MYPSPSPSPNPNPNPNPNQVLAVYLVMWLPSVFTIWIFDARFVGGNEIIFFGGLWSHMQVRG